MDEGRSSVRQQRVIAIWITAVVGVGICLGSGMIWILNGQIKHMMLLDQIPDGDPKQEVKDIGEAIRAYANTHRGEWPDDTTVYTLSTYLGDTSELNDFVYQRPSNPLVKDTPPKQQIGYFHDGDDLIDLFANGQILSHSKPKPLTD